MRLKLIAYLISVLTVITAFPLYTEASEVDKSTFTYDFSVHREDIKGELDISQTIDIDIQSTYDGYVRFTATGHDPYFAFSDAASPAPDASELCYILIKYRTDASIGKGEFYTNRTDGKQWGAEGTFFDFEYENDGNWHTVIADASKAWGKAKGVDLYAFRFDPLASGATAGDWIDVQYIKFFASRSDAEEYAEYDGDRIPGIKEGMYVLPFFKGEGSVDAEITGLDVIYGKSFVRLEGSGNIEIPSDIDNSYRYFEMLYRSESRGELTVSHSGLTAKVNTATGGLWQTASLDMAKGEGENLQIALDGGYADIIYAVFYNDPAMKLSYLCPVEPDINKYITENNTLKDMGPEYVTEVGYSYFFGRYSSDTAKHRGIASEGAEITKMSDKGYMTVTVTEKGVLSFSDAPEKISSLTDNVLIKYKADSDMKLSFTASSGTVSAMLKGDGKWRIALIDGTGILSKNGGEPLKDVKVTLEGKGVAYIAFIDLYACPEAARLAAEKEGGCENATPPAAPSDPKDAKPVVILEGDGLNVPQSYGCDATEYDQVKGCITLTSTNGDPNVNLNVTGGAIAQYVAIRYRTDVKGAVGEFFLSSQRSQPHGITDHIVIDYITDGAWHVAVVDLGQVQEYDKTANRVNYFRFDFLQKNDGTLAFGSSVDIEYIAFFNEYDEAAAYTHTASKIEGAYRITYYVMGREVYVMTYIPGEEYIEPVVPEIKGMTGVWEEYTLKEENMEVHAVYTALEYEKGPDFDVPEENEVTDVPTDDSGTGSEMIILITAVCSAVIIAAAALAVLKLRKGAGEGNEK